MDADLLVCQPRKKDGKFLLDEIMKAGNFGVRRAKQASPKPLGQWPAESETEPSLRQPLPPGSLLDARLETVALVLEETEGVFVWGLWFKVILSTDFTK